MSTVLLAIESSCDDTSAAVLIDGAVRSNVIASQSVHAEWGGIVPELASRAHTEHIVPTVHKALRDAEVDRRAIDAVAFTEGPGLIGSLLVGASIAKGLALALDVPLIGVHHMKAHVLAHFIDEPKPTFPFLCLTVSGGHTQLVLVHGPLEMEVIGETRDDAAGEAFDKTGKLMGLPYPGGPLVDKLAREGDPHAFDLARPDTGGLDFSFSGFKTSVRTLIERETRRSKTFMQDNRHDLAASIQHTIVESLIRGLGRALDAHPVQDVAIAGGVSANSGLRSALERFASDRGVRAHIPAFQYCLDNAGMIAMAGWFQYRAGAFSDHGVQPSARMPFGDQ